MIDRDELSIHFLIAFTYSDVQLVTAAGFLFQNDSFAYLSWSCHTRYNVCVSGRERAYAPSFLSGHSQALPKA